eukprot:gene11519-4683_t
MMQLNPSSFSSFKEYKKYLEKKRKQRSNSSSHINTLSLEKERKCTSDPSLMIVKEKRKSMTVDQIANRMIDDEFFEPEKKIPLDAVIKALQEEWDENIFDIL